MESLLLSHILEKLSELSPVDMMKVARVMIPVLEEQQKKMEERTKVARKEYLSTGEMFASKNWEGKDILVNAVRVRFSDYDAGVSIKDVILASDGWALLEIILRLLSKEDFYFRHKSLVLIKSEDLFRVAMGEKWIDFYEPKRRYAVASAIEKKLFYKDSEVLVKNNGAVYLIFGEDRYVVPEPSILGFFLRICNHE